MAFGKIPKIEMIGFIEKISKGKNVRCIGLGIIIKNAENILI